jgi:hypothetical protein
MSVPFLSVQGPLLSVKGDGGKKGGKLPLQEVVKPGLAV